MHESSVPHGPSVPFVDLARLHGPLRAEMLSAIGRVLDHQAFVLGEEVERFEHAMAGFCDSREAIGCSSGTDALVLSLLSLEIGPGDEVITTPFGYHATMGAIQRVGARPVFVDVEPATYNLDAARVEEAVTPRTKAILPVHLFGQCVDMEPLWRLAVREGLAIVEDACQAIGATYRGRRAGVLGTLGGFSFHPTKNLGGVGDGGLIVTDDHFLADRLRHLRSPTIAESVAPAASGLNSRLDALQAAVLAVKLPHLPAWTNARRAAAARYELLLEHYGLRDAVTAPKTAAECQHVFHQYVVRIANGQRDTVNRTLQARRLGCAVYYPRPLHLEPAVSTSNHPHTAGDFPEAERAAQESLALPVHPYVTATEQEQVVRGIAVGLGRRLVPHLFRGESQPIRRPA